MPTVCAKSTKLVRHVRRSSYALQWHRHYDCTTARGDLTRLHLRIKSIVLCGFGVRLHRTDSQPWCSHGVPDTERNQSLLLMCSAIVSTSTSWCVCCCCWLVRVNEWAAALDAMSASEKRVVDWGASTDATAPHSTHNSRVIPRSVDAAADSISNDAAHHIHHTHDSQSPQVQSSNSLSSSSSASPSWMQSTPLSLLFCDTLQRPTNSIYTLTHSCCAAAAHYDLDTQRVYNVYV